MLAERHPGLGEGMRALLQTMFEVVVMVADRRSLLESVTRLSPALAVVDLSLDRGGSLQWLSRLRAACPDVKVIAISVHDEPSVERAARAAGADGFVPKRAIADELLSVAEAVLGRGSQS